MNIRTGDVEDSDWDPRDLGTDQIRAHHEPRARCPGRYGRGSPSCPGRGLARPELGILVETVLAELPNFELASDPVRASAPAAGFAQVCIHWPPVARMSPGTKSW